MSTVPDSWRRIEAWLKSQAPTLAAALPGPASIAEIEAVETTIGFQFPIDLRESYLTQNGVEYGETELNILPTPPESFDMMAFCLLPIEQIGREWEVWKELIDGGDFEGAETEPDKGVCSDWWSDGWIPVAGNGGGDFICVDTKPTRQGTVGQVICAWHDMDERTLIAPSWEGYLESIANGMETGELSYSEDEGVVRE